MEESREGVVLAQQTLMLLPQPGPGRALRRLLRRLDETSLPAEEAVRTAHRRGGLGRGTHNLRTGFRDHLLKIKVQSGPFWKSGLSFVAWK